MTSEQTTQIAGELDASDLTVGVAVSTFNKPVTDGLRSGVIEVLERAGARDIVVAEVPGAFELPITAAGLIEAGCDAVVAVGAVIMGETDHYEHIAHRASEGLQRVALDTGVPVAFGVLTARDGDVAMARSRPGAANKGAEAAEAAIRAATVLRQLKRLRRDRAADERQRSRSLTPESGSRYPSGNN